jgi:hypothetical protein
MACVEFRIGIFFSFHTMYTYPFCILIRCIPPESYASDECAGRHSPDLPLYLFYGLLSNVLTGGEKCLTRHIFLALLIKLHCCIVLLPDCFSFPNETPAICVGDAPPLCVGGGIGPHYIISPPENTRYNPFDIASSVKGGPDGIMMLLLLRWGCSVADGRRHETLRVTYCTHASTTRLHPTTN